MDWGCVCVGDSSHEPILKNLAKTSSLPLLKTSRPVAGFHCLLVLRAPAPVTDVDPATPGCETNVSAGESGPGDSAVSVDEVRATGSVMLGAVAPDFPPPPLTTRAAEEDSTTLVVICGGRMATLPTDPGDPTGVLIGEPYEYCSCIRGDITPGDS